MVSLVYYVRCLSEILFRKHFALRKMVLLMETDDIVEIDLTRTGILFYYTEHLFGKLAECTYLRRLDLGGNELRSGWTLRSNLLQEAFL